MLKKIKINAIIEVKSGLHIGGGDSFSAIGAVDNAVIKNPVNQNPVIPGSSLKGKMRSLLSESISGKVAIDSDDIRVKRLFGSSNPILKSRILFSDCELVNAKELPYGLTTEIKFENTISRKSGVANPRQIERVIIGSKFNCNLVYNVENEAEINQDFVDLASAIKLVSLDYLGGGGSRGNGRIVFTNIKVENVDNALDLRLIMEIEKRLLDAGKYGEKLYL